MGMNLFMKYGSNISYKDILEADGAYFTCYVNYGKSSVFNGVSGKGMVIYNVSCTIKFRILYIIIQSIVVIGRY